MVFLIPKIFIAQQYITLEAAIDTAFHNNLTLKSEQLKSAYQKQLIAATHQIPNTSINTDWGQNNGVYFDTKFGISQSIILPKVYQAQKNMQTEAWKTATLHIAIKEKELRHAIQEVFYKWIYLNEKQKLLEDTDTLFTVFLEKTTIRKKNGVANLLEKVAAETQSNTSKIQIKMLGLEKDVLQSELQFLLHSESKFIPNYTTFKLVFESDLQQKKMENNPQLKVLEQQKNVNNAWLEFEKSKLLPEFSVGYSNTSIRGFGNDNVYYDGTQRFHSAQLGMQIPIFRKSQKAAMEATKKYALVIDNDYELEIQKLNTQYQSVKYQYTQNLDILNFIEKNHLSNAKTIIEIANKQFSNGDINYMEWAMLIHQSIQIKNDYIEAIKALNDNIIQLNFFNDK